MFTAKIQNAQGAILTLTNNESQYQLFDIAGIDQPSAQINFTNIATLDGAIFNSAKLDTRNIVLYIRINGNVEANRHILYQMFKTKESCIFYYKNDTVDVMIQGYVESVECPIFTDSEIMQISILCPNPYFKSVDDTVIEIIKRDALFSFPFSINEGEPIALSNYNVDQTATLINNSTNDLGMIIQIDVDKDMEEDEIVISPQITNVDTSEFFKLITTLISGDRVVINTNKGSKSVRRIRNGISTNIFSSIGSGSAFLTIPIGESKFTYSAQDGSQYMNVKFIYTEEYRGV